MDFYQIETFEGDKHVINRVHIAYVSPPPPKRKGCTIYMIEGTKFEVIQTVDLVLDTTPQPTPRITQWNSKIARTDEGGS